MDWRYDWLYYKGRVQYVAIDTTVLYGRALVSSINRDIPYMKILLDNGEKIYTHPKNVFPIE